MKLTPEQKAFYEYGRAVESLRGTIYKIRKNAIHGFGEPYRRLMMHEQKCLINAMGLASKIHVVRQKRAACRIKCGQCVHFSIDEWGPRKDGCLKRCCGVKSDRCAVGCRYWEPRKEASND